ncbi:hypothetical protein OY671_007677, partial [Metschnikowia pulcherrima]
MTRRRGRTVGHASAGSASASASPLGTSAGSAKSKDEKTAPAPAGNENPYPSTYRAYPGEPVAIVGATVFDGAGGRIDNGTVSVADGKVQAVGDAASAVPATYRRIDGTGKFVTPGVIDIHSHSGVYPSPGVDAHQDGNEMTSPTTPQVWAEHSVWPQDPGFSRASANGGVTTSQISPGSANSIGGRSVVLKNVPSRTVQGMKFPDAPYGRKRAGGENPKRVDGAKGQRPSTRMGNFAVDRQTWIKAAEYKRKRDAGKSEERDLGMETSADVSAGKISVQNHCYRADEMAFVIDMAREFGYKVSAFHHAVEAYKIGDSSKQNDICAAVWADWWGFKMEAFDGIPENAASSQDAGVCVIIHSDDDYGIQRSNQEAAKAQGDGRRIGIAIPDEQVVRWFTLNPAKASGIDAKTGSSAAGKMGDVVSWNGNPSSVYARPEKVWVDGAS